ncbi:cytochrome bc1 complex cytochrome b subunit [Herbiconiux ginsengi]|uniref:Cytochrome bc1 complex cytochrome b subunit n=1 Tax=Herbiconiux ginsengi TaxID=381665 RepID=A0A1H3RX29_9MICO|nr:cytochrome bc complex cytochrome b subunit [Herbiconiux ginsengi]SDZ30266.1 ubiquinol-cytochrome c reductase cytochrome b subunit [Herbiconiux ginsengi]
MSRARDARGGRSLSDRIAVRLDDSTVFGHRIRDVRAELNRRMVPNHWSRLFGVVAMASLVVILVTGLLLMFFYVPSSETVTTTTHYPPLAGVETSKAFASTLQLSLDVQGGLLLRQAHHWAALILPAALVLHLLTTFFTGGFRRPRRGQWVLLFLILIVSLVGGWSGYALPDDMLSGTGLRIVEGIVLGIPVIGTWASGLLFGGEFPGEIIEHLYPVHVAVVPAALIVLIGLRALAGWTRKPPQFRGVGRTEENVVGIPLPNAAVRAVGLGALVCGVILLIAATVTINPIWAYGPSSPGDASAGSQPDWYTGFLDGALRLIPPGWEFEWLGHTWTLALLIPLVVVSLFFAIVALYPFLEEWITRDHRDHNLLDRPRSRPTRTGIGVAAVVFSGTLWAAGSADVIAAQFHVTFEGVILFFQITVLAGPPVAFWITRRAAIGLQRRDLDILEHGFETGRIVRLPGGEYVEVHAPVDGAERARLLAGVAAGPSSAGGLTDGRSEESELDRRALAGGSH